MTSQQLPFRPVRGGVTRQAAASKHSKRRIAGVVTRDGSELRIKFSEKHHPYINAVKTIRGYRYDRASNSWSVHISSVRHVRDLADEHGWILSPAVRNIPDLAADEFPMTVAVEGDQLVIDGPYHGEAWHMLGEADARQEIATGKWYVPSENAVDVILDLRRLCRVQFIGDENDLSRSITEALRMLALSRALEPSPGWQLTDRVVRDLRAFQHPGVEYLVETRQAFSWATMGAGKTTVALAALEQMAANGDDVYPVIVVPPSGLKTNWAREVKACIPHRSTFICEGKRARLPLHEPDVFICNYDILGPPSNRSSWSSTLIGTVKSLVVDEGHRCINPKTIRTAAVQAVSNSLDDDAPRFLLTGTPVRNKRDEVHPQLAIIGRDGQFGDKKQIRKDERLSRRLRTVCAWRPDPDEVLKSLGVLRPDGTAEIVPQVTYVDGDPKVLEQYREAEDNILDFLRKKAMEKAEELGEDPESAAVEAVMKAGSAEQLMVVNTLCRLAGQAKIHAAREWVSDFLDSGEKLLVFAENHDMIDAIAGSEIPKIDGRVKRRDRDLIVDRFQEEDGIDEADYLQAIVLQIDAAGEGLTLTEAHQVLHAQLCWTPGQHDQADARAAWRMNDPHNIIAHYLVCVDTIDEDRMDVLASKREEMRFVTDGDREQMAATSTYGDVFAKLLSRALKKGS